MNALIAMSLPTATSGYLALYVVTFAVHFVLMSYVLVGTVLLLPRPESESLFDRLQRVVRDWLPFMLGLTITAGVAPLLFIQILYRDRFYTANLLLFHRWMSILPVLIIDFYLLYLIKSPWFDRRTAWQRFGIVSLTALGFFYVGISWTENHLLSLESVEGWASKYLSPVPFYLTISVVPRTLVWLAAVCVVFPALLCWQLASLNEERRQVEARRLCARVALIALGLVLVSQLLYCLFLPSQVRAALFRSDGIGLIILTMVTAGGVAGAWIAESRRAIRGQPTRVLVLMVATSLWVLSNSLLREMIRLAQVDVAAISEQHAEAAQVGGLGTFLTFLVINTGLIAYCIRRVRADRLKAGDSPADA